MCGAGPYLRASKDIQKPNDSIGGEQNVLYWERGGSGFGLCAVHCLNSLLQGPLFSEVQLAELAHELDEEEALLLGFAPGDVGAGPSQNVSANGDFSSQVLLRALQVHFGLDVVDAMKEDIRDEVLERPQQEAGYICNLRRHWFAIRSLPWSGRSQWFNLDSRSAEGPTLLNPEELPVLLKSVRRERGTIFVVRGDFPDSAHAELRSGDGLLESHQMLLDANDIRRLREEALLALDESIVHRLLDAAKLGKWMSVFEELKKVEQGRGDQRGPRYVDALPFPRRFALIHYAAAQGREEAVKKLMGQFMARLDLKTAEGVSIEDLALQMNHRGVAELVASERRARERAGSDPAPEAVSRSASRASNNPVPAESRSTSRASNDPVPAPGPSSRTVPASDAVSPAPLPVPDVAACGQSVPAPQQQPASAEPKMPVPAPSPSREEPGALDDAVAHKLLDQAKYGKWDQLFVELAAAERTCADGHRRYVDHFPPPRRYGLVHFAANQGRAEVLRRLIQEFGARSDVKTLDGLNAGDIVAIPAHKEEVRAVLRAAARTRK